ASRLAVLSEAVGDATELFQGRALGRDVARRAGQRKTLFELLLRRRELAGKRQCVAPLVACAHRRRTVARRLGQHESFEGCCRSCRDIRQTGKVAHSKARRGRASKWVAQDLCEAL